MIIFSIQAFPEYFGLLGVGSTYSQCVLTQKSGRGCVELLCWNCCAWIFSVSKKVTSRSRFSWSLSYAAFINPDLYRDMLWIERRKTRRSGPLILWYKNIFHTEKKGWKNWLLKGTLRDIRACLWSSTLNRTSLYFFFTPKRCTYVSSSALTNWTCLCCYCWWRLAIAKKIHLSTLTHLHAIPNSMTFFSPWNTKWNKNNFHKSTINGDWSYHASKTQTKKSCFPSSYKESWLKLFTKI